MNQIENGAYVAAITPMDNELNIDRKRLVSHSKWLLDQGATGVLLMGSAGEANSFSIEERESVVEPVLSSGISADKLLIGTGCCSYKDTIRLTQHALDGGVRHILMLPPFYYKNISDQGLYQYFEKIINHINNPGLRIYLYHFPAMSSVYFSGALVNMLVDAFPQQLAGMKDSGGDWKHTKDMHINFPTIKTFVGNEKYLSNVLNIGGPGCITASLNLSVSLAARLFAENNPQEISHIQKQLNALREMVEGYPLIPAIKFAISLIHDDQSWRNVRPPQVQLSAVQQQKLAFDMESASFPKNYILES